MLLIYALYIAVSVLLAVYGINALVLTFLYLRTRDHGLSLPETNEWPAVTVQVPTFNERYVVERVIEAVANLDYPADRLQIQILDDSTDETMARAAARIAWHQARGLDITLLHRRDRVGFKAGALAAGLNGATGEIIAIFDADFVPPRDFLRQTVPYFVARPELGMVQARWGHLNPDYSLLTRTQSLALDGHFIVEQSARQRSGLFMNFNGTAGLWRHVCIDDAGGWRHDTVCEDLDLSYRAQLAGWQFLFLPDVEAPAEIPAQITAFKRQQFRWAKGSIQCARLLSRRVLGSRQPLIKRWQGIVHLTGYLVHPFMLLMLLASVPLMAAGVSMYWPLAYLSLASLGPPILYAASQRALHTDWRRRCVGIAMLMLLGTGTAASNTVAVFEALAGRANVFLRTPKFGLETRGDHWSGKDYVLSALSPLTIAEFALSAFAGVGVAVALNHRNPVAALFLLLYTAGFGYVALLTVVHSLSGGWRGRRRRTALRRRMWPITGQGDS